jgi:hypothetical protein
MTKAAAARKKAPTTEGPQLIKTTPELQAGDELKEFDPLDPRIIVDQKKNGRAYPWTRETLSGTIHSILDRGVLLEPPVGHWEDDLFHIDYGFGRTLAMQVIAKEKLASTPIPFRVIVRDVKGRDTFIDNLHENRKRRNTTPVDDAHNIKVLLEEKGYSMKDVCNIYADATGKPASPAWVRQRRKIADATEEEQRRWHEQAYAAEAATFLVDEFPDAGERKAIDEEAQKIAVEEIETEIEAPMEVAQEILKEVEKELPPQATQRTFEKKVLEKAEKLGVKESSARKIAAKKEAIKKPRPGKKQIIKAADKLGKGKDLRQRKLPDFLAVWEAWGAPNNPKVPAQLRRMANTYLEWKEGVIDSVEMENRLRGLLGVKLLKVA